MNNLTKGLLIGGAILVVIFTILYSSGELSLITSTDFEELPVQISCEVPQDCYDGMIEIGFPKADLDEQLNDIELLCRNNVCGGRLK